MPPHGWTNILCENGSEDVKETWQETATKTTGPKERYSETNQHCWVPWEPSLVPDKWHKFISIIYKIPLKLLLNHVLSISRMQETFTLEIIPMSCSI